MMRRRIPTLIALLASATLALAVSSIGAPQSATAQARPGLSSRVEPSRVEASIVLGAGVTSPLSTGQLFGPDIKLVPGDTETASFIVKNASDDPALLSIALNGASAEDPSLLNVLTVKASAPHSQVSSGAPIGAADSCPMLVQQTPVSAGGSVTVNVSISLAPSVDGMQNETELSTFDFLADLQQATTAATTTQLQCTSAARVSPTLDGRTPLYQLGAPSSGTSKPTKPTNPASGQAATGHHTTASSTGGLAWTGANVLIILIVGAALVAGGAGFLIVAAQRRQEDADVPYDAP